MGKFLEFLGNVANAAAGVLMTERAIQGDQPTIAQLIAWHDMNDDPDGARRWRDIYNRDPAALFDLGVEVAQSADPQVRAYAAYWFAQAHARGHLLAASRLRQLSA